MSDLLDLRQIKDGIFTLAREVFDPADVFNLICNIFNPQASSKGVSVSWKIMTQETQIEPHRRDEGIIVLRQDSDTDVCKRI